MGAGVEPRWRSCCFRNSDAKRRPIPREPRCWRAMPDDIGSTRHASPTAGADARPDAAAASIGPQPVVIQVARSEAPMRDRAARPAADPRARPAAGRGAGRVWAATRWRAGALAPVERMTERARSITAERLSDRLPVAQSRRRDGPAGDGVQRDAGAAGGVVRADAAVHGGRLARAAHAADLDPQRRRSRACASIATNADTASIIGSMLEEADRLAGLVDRLLTLSRAETGQAKLSREIVDLQALAEKSSRTSACWPRRRSRRSRSSASARPHARADRLCCARRSSTSWTTRSSSARRAAASRIRVSEARARSIARRDRHRSRHRRPTRATRIFDRFYRAATAAGAAPGTGLGLSIAKGAVEANAGRLTLESAEPGACTFRVTLPRLDPHARLKAS